MFRPIPGVFHDAPSTSRCPARGEMLVCTFSVSSELMLRVTSWTQTSATPTLKSAPRNVITSHLGKSPVRSERSQASQSRRDSCRIDPATLRQRTVGNGRRGLLDLTSKAGER